MDRLEHRRKLRRRQGQIATHFAVVRGRCAIQIRRDVTQDFTPHGVAALIPFHVGERFPQADREERIRVGSGATQPARPQSANGFTFYVPPVSGFEIGPGAGLRSTHGDAHVHGHGPKSQLGGAMRENSPR